MAKPRTSLKAKILEPNRLKKRLLALRKLKSNIKFIFTNGCFDLLHPGHVSYLEKASHLGTHLIVALNTDASVRKIKGRSRPVNTLNDRLQVIAALESVSFVTWFDNDTPLELILSLKPDYLVKGGDWKPSQIIGSKEGRRWGCKTKSIKFIEGKSTTRLIEKMKK